MANRKLFLLPGDGIGPEAMAEVRKLIEFMNAEESAGFETDEGLQTVGLMDLTMADLTAGDIVVTLY